MNPSPSLRVVLAIVLTAAVLGACSTSSKSRYGYNRARMQPAQCDSLDSVATGSPGLFSSSASSLTARREALDARSTALLSAVTESMLDSQYMSMMSLSQESDGAVKLVVPGSVMLTPARTLNPDFLETINRLAEAVGRYCDVDVQIVGHTDSNGDAIYNRKVSLSRANDVKKYLSAALGRYGVYDRHITTEGMGSTMPVTSNYSDEGRSQNRRVEIFLVPPRLP